MDEKLDAAYLALRWADKFQKKPKQSTSSVDIAQEIERVSRAARLKFPPANLERLGRYLQVGEVREAPLAIRGRLIAENGLVMVEINNRLEPFEKRKVLAHELAHLLFDRDRVRSGFFNSGQRSGETSKEYYNVEEVCDLAAAEILLPEKWLISQVPRDPSLQLIKNISLTTDCQMDFVAGRILKADLWRGCHFMWWICREGRMVVERALPKEDAITLSSYEKLDATSSLPARALLEDSLIRGKIWIKNSFVSKFFSAECMRISETEVVALIK